MFSSGYQFAVPGFSHIDSIVEIFTRSFCRSEPMTSYLHMDEEKFKIFARAVAENAIKDGLSIIALDKDKVIACALVEDLAQMREVPLDFDPKFKYIAALLESLGGNFFSNKHFPPKHIAHLFISAVHEDYRRQGLSTQVNLKAMQLAAEAGFKFVYSELTNIYNEYGIFHHLDVKKKLVGKCIYKDFTLEGEKPFANLSGEAHGYLWEIYKNTPLRYTSDEKEYTKPLEQIS